MDILDQRVVMVVFVDNANLSASVAKTIGTLLRPAIKDQPGIAELRRELEQFLDDQQAGYARLYDAKAGLFYFGWDATQDRLFGWEDLQGKWTTGHVDYLVNEFRGPATFVVAPVRPAPRCDQEPGLQDEAVPDARRARSSTRWPPGRARRSRPWGWASAMTRARSAELAHAAGERGRRSRSTTPRGTSSPASSPSRTRGERHPVHRQRRHPRHHRLAPAADHRRGVALHPGRRLHDRARARSSSSWRRTGPIVSKLLTDHGPWEGYNVTRHEVIPFQTTAHTLALILGLLGTGSDHMKRYLDSKGLGRRLDELFAAGEEVDLLAGETQVFAWTDKESTRSSPRREQGRLPRQERPCQQCRDRASCPAARGREPVGRVAAMLVPRPTAPSIGRHRPETAVGQLPAVTRYHSRRGLHVDFADTRWR